MWKRLWTRKVGYVIHAFSLTLILLTWRIWRAPNNVSNWQMGFNSAFKGLEMGPLHACCSKTGSDLGNPGLGNHSLASKTQINDDVCDLTTVSISNILIALVIDELCTHGKSN